jgi:aminoglycoside phosphotransferase (APT) family kinase protein
MQANSAEMAERILAFLKHQLPAAHGIAVTGLRRVSGGVSTENWLFDATWTQDGSGAREELVLRCASANEIVEASREDEFLLLQALAADGLPAPRAYWMDRSGEWIGRPAMVLERRPGRTERGMLGEKNSLGLNQASRVGIARQMADALIAIHAIDVDRIPHLRLADERPAATRQLHMLQAAVARDELDREPELVLAALWLGDHLPPVPVRESIVHGDYRPANVLVKEDKITGVLDWELAHRGDPAEDLGWYLASVYRHEHFIPGAWSPQDFLDRYAEGTGSSVDPAAVRFWAVFAVYKLAIIAFNSMRALAAGDHARLNPPPHRLIEALMRDICESSRSRS